MKSGAVRMFGARALVAGLMAGGAARVRGAGDGPLQFDLTARGDSSAGAVPGADDHPTVTVGGFTQFRYILNWRTDPPRTNGPDSGFTNGFEMARARLETVGEISGKDLTFNISAEFGSTGDVFTLLNAYAAYVVDNRNTIEIGQFRLPLWREWSVDESKQLLVNSSVMTEGLNPGYTQGIGLTYTGNTTRIFVSVNDGIRASNTDFESPAEADFAMAGRFEIKGSGGDWALFDDFTAWRGQPTAWMAGLGVIYDHRGDTASTTDITQQTLVVVAADLSFEGSGWNAYGAFVLANADPDSNDFQIYDVGLVVQGGYFVTDAVELAGRVDAVIPDHDRGRGVDTNDWTITAGGNWYLFPKSHAAKLSTDLQWFINQSFGNGIVRPIVDVSNADIRSDQHGNQFTLRFQFQLVF